ncbi:MULTISPECIES: hypothetical protein [Spirosoma]|uniref:Uncharacterized protein n=1 Tax=Spirosoma liriopis TaxID=2937440 RepID=A0ABT0HP77_9BACT|nr:MULTISPECIES: hypothetical protein [Spirosoma]MCK8493981.1 hypothetical protein [Spirosoma liriopis]UHG89000.1 hypothetical protein LQ777_12155 [Spirosoma oryzicola]
MKVADKHITEFVLAQFTDKYKVLVRQAHCVGYSYLRVTDRCTIVLNETVAYRLAQRILITSL